MNLEIETWCGPEAQVAALSDDIAYFSHDFEDAASGQWRENSINTSKCSPPSIFLGERKR